MKKENIIEHTQEIINQIDNNYFGAKAQAMEFIRNYGGKDSHFLKSLEIPYSSNASSMKYQLEGILKSFIKYIESDLLRFISVEREIQIETVSDYLSQAELLLNDKNVHPAAPAVIIGSSLEEFLRNWLEEKEVDMTKIKPSLESYNQELRKMELISKQDVKDIVSWSGTRNDAAHGIWENVSDRNRIKLMLEGVNLFMRKYTQKSIV